MHYSELQQLRGRRGMEGKRLFDIGKWYGMARTKETIINNIMTGHINLIWMETSFSRATTCFMGEMAQSSLLGTESVVDHFQRWAYWAIIIFNCALIESPSAIISVPDFPFKRVLTWIQTPAPLVAVARMYCTKSLSFLSWFKFYALVLRGPCVLFLFRYCLETRYFSRRLKVKVMRLSLSSLSESILNSMETKVSKTLSNPRRSNSLHIVFALRQGPLLESLTHFVPF